MANRRPLLVVLTPVRNEAWVLRAFLEATSLWADYIIIADQMSTDGSREIAKEYPKVILIDNDRKEMHQAATRRLLFEEAKKIDGDKILFALDADEFLSGDFMNEEDWRRIMNSKPDDSFWWRWMNLKEGDTNLFFSGPHLYWAVHESEDLWNGEFPDNSIHEWRLPWSSKAGRSQKFLLNDFYSIHLAWVNQRRQRNKERFYQVTTYCHDTQSSCITLSRHYHDEKNRLYEKVPEDVYTYYINNNLDIWRYIDLEDEGKYYTIEVLDCFNRRGISEFAFLDIWDPEWMKRNGLKDPRAWYQRLLHGYLHRTMPFSNTFLVRCVDKILKQIV